MLALIAYNVLRLLVKAISGLLTALWDGTERQQGVRILQKWDITPFWKRGELKNMTQANTIGISRENWNKEMFFKYLENNKEFWVMANTSWLDHLGIFPKAPRLKRCSVDGKPNWSQQHYAVARKERKQNQNQKQQKKTPKYLSKHHMVYSQEWFLPGLWCAPLISSSAAKILLELCAQSGALGFKLIEEPGQRD